MSEATNRSGAEGVQAKQDAGQNRPYIDQLNNDESDLRDIRLAKERIISPKDRRILGLLAGLNILVFALIGLYLIMTGAADEYDSIKGESDFNMKTPYYNSSVVLTGELEPTLETAEYPYGMQEKFRPLFSVNDDTVGWVRIDGTPVDYVVVQSETNSYYERKDFYENYSVRGIIFMDYRNILWDTAPTMSKNTVLYGHHMASDGSVFTCLENYTDLDYYKAHPVIEYDTLYANYKWKIIGAFLNYPNDPSEGDDLFYYWYTDFSDENTVAFANEVVGRSFFINASVDVQPTDHFLTLSTCTYMLDRGSRVNARFVVVARLVRDGESAAVDVDKAFANEDRRMPQLWYDIHDEENPYADVPIWQAY
ncbi:MAG: class B sortase [Clostridia bacterium]|nr:class B sortase [Clostridia bacterium]